MEIEVTFRSEFEINVTENWCTNARQADALKAEIEKLCNAAGMVNVSHHEGYYDTHGFEIEFEYDFATDDEDDIPNLEPVTSALKKFLTLEKQFKENPYDSASTFNICEQLHYLDRWMNEDITRSDTGDEDCLAMICGFPYVALSALLYNPKPVCSGDGCHTYKCTNTNHTCPELKADLADMREHMEREFQVIFGEFFNVYDPVLKREVPNPARPATISDADVEVVEAYLFDDFVECTLTACYDAYMDRSQPIDEDDRAYNAKRLAAAVAVVSKITT